MLGSPIGPTVMAMQASIGQVMHHPLGVFSLLVAISAAVPPLIRRIGLPDLVGLLVAGVVVGPHALNWVDSGSETVRLLSDLGAVDGRRRTTDDDDGRRRRRRRSASAWWSWWW